MSNQSSDQRRQPEDQTEKQAKKQSRCKDQSYSTDCSRVQFFRRAVRVVRGTKENK